MIYIYKFLEFSYTNKDFNLLNQNIINRIYYPETQLFTLNFNQYIADAYKLHSISLV